MFWMTGTSMSVWTIMISIAFVLNPLKQIFMVNQGKKFSILTRFNYSFLTLREQKHQLVNAQINFHLFQQCNSRGSLVQILRHGYHTSCAIRLGRLNQ